MKPQNVKIYNHMRAGWITQQMAIELYKVYRLSARVNEIKKVLPPTQRIDSVTRRHNDVSYKAYRILEETNGGN